MHKTYGVYDMNEPYHFEFGVQWPMSRFRSSERTCQALAYSKCGTCNQIRTFLSQMSPLLSQERITGSQNLPPWRNWLARPTVKHLNIHREVRSSSLRGGVFFPVFFLVFERRLWKF